MTISAATAEMTADVAPSKGTTTRQIRRLNSLIANLRGDLMVAELDAEIMNPHDADAVEANDSYTEDLKSRISGARRELCRVKETARMSFGDAAARRLLFRASA